MTIYIKNSPLAHGQQLWLAIIRISRGAFKPMMTALGDMAGRQTSANHIGQPLNEPREQTEML